MTDRTIAHYQILEKLGEGGMGVVWKARDTRLNRLVALKMLRKEAVANRERRARFIQEAQAASALNHPNIVTVYDIGEHDGEMYIAMEFVDGRSLDRLIGNRPLPLRDTLRYGIAIADALHAAHEAGIVHRDLKPLNVMVTDKGALKVLDFGLAKLAEPAAPGPDEATITDRVHTEEGTILGTAAYMSPEQTSGAAIDQRSDIFSFGSMLYEMATGRRAFQADSKMALLAAILNREPAPMNPAPPRDLEKVIQRCLRKEPSRRFQHMDDLRVALEELKEESESGKLTVGADAHAGARKAARWPMAVAIGGAVIAVAVGTVWLARRNEPAPPPPAALEPVPLTTYKGSETQPDISPDGKQVVFCWDGETKGAPNLYVKLIGVSGPPLRITNHSGADSSPKWSPDGTQIAFYRANAIYIVPGLGGPERKLADVEAVPLYGPPPLAWSPDGKLLVIPSRAGTAADGAGFGMAIVSLVSGEKRVLTRPSPAQREHGPAVFSPDGSRIVFSDNETSGAGDLFSLPVSGGEATQLTDDKERTMGLAWIPGSNDVTFVNRGALWRTDSAHMSKPRRLPVSVPQTLLSISRTGRIVYALGTYDTNVWEQTIGGAPKPLVASTRGDFGPQLAPDGSRVAFSSDRTGSQEIWICNRDGSNPIQMSALGGIAHSVRWSPDSKHLVFSCLLKGNRDIYSVRADGGPPKRLTQEESEEGRPSVSRDGKWIYFYSRRSGSMEIWKIPFEGGGARRVTKSGGHESVESWDGKRLYFNKAAIPRSGDLWSMAVEGGDERLELRTASQGWWDVVAGGLVFVTLMPTGASPIYSWQPGRESVKIGEIKSRLARGGRSIAASPDGKTIFWPQADRIEADLMMIENFQ